MAEYVDNFSDLKELGIDCDSNELDETFGRAADHLPQLISNLDDEILLMLYSYYKQGKDGICNVPKPSWFDFKGRSKWEAWKKLENMPKEKAKALYIETIKKIDPNFNCNEDKKKETWVCVSTLKNENDLELTDKNIVDFVKENNRSEVFAILSKKGADQINKLDENGLSLLHWASDIGSVDIISDLISYGANVNSRDSEGQTALHYSASCGHEDCVRFLLSKGAQVDIRDNEGLTPADVACDQQTKKLLSSSL